MVALRVSFSYEAAHKHARACNGLSYMSGHRGRAKASNPARFVMVATNCLTGKAEYLEEKQSAARVIDIVRASSSLPYVTKITHVDGVPMLDGDIVDSLPVEYALSQGYERLVVVLTRNKGYRKYPLLQKALQNRNAEYNRVIELIEKLEDEGYAEASKVLSFFLMSVHSLKIVRIFEQPLNLYHYEKIILDFSGYSSAVCLR